MWFSGHFLVLYNHMLMIVHKKELNVYYFGEFVAKFLK